MADARGSSRSSRGSESGRGSESSSSRESSTSASGGESSHHAGTSSHDASKAADAGHSGGGKDAGHSAGGKDAGLDCPGKGAYCGNDGVTGGSADTLYQCPGKGEAPSSSTVCSSGCQVEPSGTADSCKKSGGLVCPGAGAYCGNDGVTGGSAGTLYQCPGAGEAPSSSTVCSNGCKVEPSGTSDYCISAPPPDGGSCPSDYAAALAWEAGVISAGDAGNCSGSPPSCCSDWCLEFVADAFSNAGVSVPELAHGYAYETIADFQNAGNWTAWSSGAVPPCGAIVVWAAAAGNGGDGHIVISNGDGTASTSGWPGYAGSSNAAISWLSCRGERVARRVGNAALSCMLIAPLLFTVVRRA